MTIFTVDVSSWDGPVIDWAQARQAGITAACVKATEGGGPGYRYANPYFATQFDSAVTAGLPLVGAYHCLSSDSVQQQISYLEQVVGERLGRRNTWVMLDVEPFDELRLRGLTPRFQDLVAFCEVWTTTFGEPLAVYLPHWVWELWGHPDLTGLAGQVALIASNYPHPIAYGFRAVYDHIGGDRGVGWAGYGGRTPDLWQYTSKGLVPGLRGGIDGVDVNAFRGDLAALTQLLTGTTSPTPIPTSTDPTEEIVQQLPLLAQGATGQHVRDAQALFNVHGFSLSLDGLFGPRTDDAVRAFQVTRAVPNSVVGGRGDGQIGPHTWAALLDVA